MNDADPRLLDATYEDVRKSLEAEEAEESKELPALHKQSASSYIHAMIKLEERQ